MKLNIIQIMLIYIAGYDLSTARSCTSSEINKMCKHATLILIPAMVGLFSMTYAIFLITENLLLSIVGGVIWGICIFFIDRSLVSSCRPGTLNVSMLGRLLFAMVIGFVVAEPIVLLTFKDAINEVIADEIIEKETTIKDKYSADYLALDNKLSNAKKSLEELRKSYTAEMDGTGGSGVADKGPIFRQKYNDYLKELVTYKELEKQISEDRDKVNQKYNNELIVVKDNQANGLLGQFRALHSIKDKEVAYATWALRFFFFFIEIIPFLIKVSPSKEGDLYYDIKENNDQLRREVINSSNTLKKELLEKKEKAMNLEKILKLNELNIKKVALSYQLNSEFLSEQMFIAAKNKMKQDIRAMKKIKNDSIRDELLKQIDTIYQVCFENLEELINKSNQFYNNM